MRSLYLLILLSACSVQSRAIEIQENVQVVQCKSSENSARHEIFVSNIGWHTGVVVSGRDAAELGMLVPEVNRLAWVEFGWGDSEFYQASGTSYWDGVRAMFLSSGAALHVAGFNHNPEEFLKESKLHKLVLDDDGLQGLIHYLRDSMALDDSNRSQRLGESLYWSGSFYAAKGDFSFRRTCNTWTAEALRAAGCDVDTSLIRASSLSRSIEKLGIER